MTTIEPKTENNIITGIKKNPLVSAVWICLFAFCLVSFIIACVQGVWNDTVVAAGTVLFICGPALCEKALHITLSPLTKIIFMLYAVSGPLMGNVYHLYYLLPWWDKFLHLLCGIMFTIFGLQLPELADASNARHSTVLKCICGFCFAMAIGVVWEFFEFACDMLVGTDMQRDSILYTINSYDLGAATGVTGTISDITEVVVNGQSLDLGGYIDIGLLDTMYDQIACFAGSVIVCVAAGIKKDAFPKMYIRTER